MRLKNAVLDSDLENVKALVGDLNSMINFNVVEGSTAIAETAELPPVNLATMNPNSREELLEYASMINKKCATFEEMASYPFFVETLVRDLVVSLSLEDTRKVSACLNVIVPNRRP
jgi:hypothetical protein